MTLGERQRKFMRLLPRLIDEAHRLGYELTGGELMRTPEQALLYAKQGRGIAASLHQVRCAIDLNLFKDGKYLDKNEDHRELGRFWESLDPCCRSGVRYNDGNHYELLDKPRTGGPL
jgi:hypothetical protein